jgi:predicted permease
MMLARLRSYVRTLRGRNAFEDGMDEEMRFHLERRTEDLVRRGLSPADAARRARLEFGSIEKQKDLARASVGVRLLDELRGDVSYALRTFVRNKGFAATAIVTLALGIGANAAIFSLFDALMLRWLPVSHPEQLLQVTKTSPDGTSDETFSYPMVRALDDRQDLFTGVAGFSGATFTVGSGMSMQRVRGAYVTGAFYETLGLTPAAGRLLTRADDAPGAQAAAVASYGYWQQQFAGSPAAVGQTLLLDGVPVVIAGVSPRGFVGANVGSVADLTLAVAVLPRLEALMAPLLGPGNSWLRVVARPRPDLTPGEATARLAAGWPQIAERSIDPKWSATRKNGILQVRPALVPGGTGWTYLRSVYARPLQVLMGVVALVLIIACANVASLMLARAGARRKEIAVRLAIGAGRGRLVRQLLVESVTLSLLGAGAAVFLARVAGGLIVSVISTSRTAIVVDLTPNWHVIAFTTAVAIVTAMLFGIAPALQSTAAGPAQVLKDDAGTTARSRLLPAIVAAQMALSLILLIGAALFVRTLRNLHTLDPGFRAEGVLIAGLEQQPGILPSSILESVHQIPGVISASISTHTPLSGATWSEPALPEGQTLPERDTAVFIGASPGFFATLQIPLLAGREFAASDTRQSLPVAIVNERYAQRYFPNQSPIGRRLSAIVRHEKRELEIVGVARSANTSSLRRTPPPTVFVPYAQLTGDVPTNVEVRVSGSLAAVAAALRPLLQPLLPNAPVEIGGLSSQVEATLVQERMMATLATGFGLLALALAAVGIYGLLAYGVVRRTREIGIRMALGAPRRGIVALVVGGAWRPLAAGVAIGLPAAWGASRWVASMLFGLKPIDPVGTAAAIAMLVAIAHVAAWLPARRAARVDPLVALRQE